jgi:hypothetical protein
MGAILVILYLDGDGASDMYCTRLEKFVPISKILPIANKEWFLYTFVVSTLFLFSNILI